MQTAVPGIRNGYEDCCWIWHHLSNIFGVGLNEDDDYFTTPFRRDKLSM